VEVNFHAFLILAFSTEVTTKLRPPYPSQKPQYPVKAVWASGVDLGNSDETRKIAPAGNRTADIQALPSFY
jgi:hypothetical protein